MQRWIGNLWVLCKVVRLFDGIQKPHMKIDLWEGCEGAEIPRKAEKSIGFQAEGREKGRVFYVDRNRVEREPTDSGGWLLVRLGVPTWVEA